MSNSLGSSFSGGSSGGGGSAPVDPYKKYKEELEAYNIRQARSRYYETQGNPLDDLQGVLNVVGLVPVAGELFDGINGLLYIGRGDKINASASFSAMIPLIGVGTKYTIKASNHIIVKQTAKKADLLFNNKNGAMNWARKQLGHNTERMYDINGKWIGWSNSKGSVYWGHRDWGKGVGSSTFPHLNYKIDGVKGHLFLEDKIKNRGMYNDFINYFNK